MRDVESYNDEEFGEEGALGRVQAYRIAVEVARTVVKDAQLVLAEPALREVGPQLVRAVGSIAANIAEGYPRRSRADRVRYYEYALGSALEARRWCSVAYAVLPGEILRSRLSSLASIRRLLLAMIRNDRDGKTWGTPSNRRS
jgi:four helix bundle protein